MRPQGNRNKHSTLPNYLERLAELVTHDVVEERIDAGGHKKQHARDVVDAERQVLVDGAMLDVCENDSLNVKRTPAQEEGNHNHDCGMKDLFIL